MCLTMMCGNVFAQEKIEDDLDYTIIENNGIEIKVSEKLNDVDKNYVIEMMDSYPSYKPEGIIESVTTQTLEINEQIGDSENKTKTISKSKLQIDLITELIVDSDEAKYKVTTLALWKTIPIMKLNDIFGLAWGGEFSVYNYSARGFWKAGSQTAEINVTLNSIDPNMGIAYDYQCGNNDNDFDFDPWYIQIDVYLKRAKSSSKNESANVVAKYAHATSSIGSISVGYANFTISFEGTYEGAEPKSTVIYY